MAWFPGAIRKEITRHRTAIVGPRRYMLHTAVSASSSLFNYFNQRGNPTSHFYVRADGTVEQYVSTAYRAPAQLEGNHDSISVETQDIGGPFPSWSGSNVPAWTSQQIESLARIGAWLHKTHRIKLQLCPNSRPGTEGFAYHRQGIDPWRVSGGEKWSNAYGKVCPGDRRIKQVPTVLNRAKQIVTGIQEEDMPLDAADKEWFRYTMRAILDEKVFDNVWKTDEIPAPDGYDTTENPTWAASSMLRSIQFYARQAALSSANLDELAAAIAAKLPAGSVDVKTVKAGVRAVLTEGVGA